MKFSENELKAAAKLRNLEERRAKIAQKKLELERKEALINIVLVGKNRKRDTARKILLGSYILKVINNDKNAYFEILQGLDKYLVKERDKQLFPELEDVIFRSV